MPVKSRFGTFAGSGTTIRQRSTTIVFGLAVFSGPSLAIFQGMVSVQRGFAAGHT